MTANINLYLFCASLIIFSLHSLQPRHMKSFLLFRLLPALTLVMALADVVLGQPGSGGPGPGGNPAAQVPLDGGVSLLLAGGVAYGLKRLRERRRRA